MGRALGYLTVRLHQFSSMSKRFTTQSNAIRNHTLFIPGCSLASYDSVVLEALVSDLKRYDSQIGLYVNCCAKPLLDIGDVDGHHRQLAKLKHLFLVRGVKEIIVGCSNCYSVFKEVFNNIRVVTLWEVIASIGVPLGLVNHYRDRFEYAIHDPCPTNAYPPTRNSVRKIISELGIPVVEFDHRGKCCGSKGMKRALFPELWHETALKRINESPSEHILSYCQSCVQTLSIAGNPTLHLLDFLYNPKVIENKHVHQAQSFTIKAWQNRYRASR